MCPSDWLTISGPCRYSNLAFELFLWTIAFLLLVPELVWDRDWKGLLRAFRSNWLVLGFTGLAGLSMIWSIQAEITLYKFIVLLGSSMMAIYFGHIFDLERLLKILTRFFVWTSLLSLLLVWFIPNFTIETITFFEGSWRGIFCHRNYLGVFMAIGMVLFLVNVLFYKDKRKIYFYFNLVMLVVVSVLLFKSQSATGIISALVTVGFTLLVFAWIRWGQGLKAWHYFVLFGGALVALIVVLTNLDFFLGFFGRNASLTGRVPMWQHLFQNIISKRPWLGHGYGAIWHFDGLISELTQTLNWGVIVGIGDNGMIDIFLHLGIVGVTVILILIGLGFIRAIRYFLQERTIIAAFPTLLLVFGVVANISLSLILEIETMVWMIAVASVAAVSSKPYEKISA
jgi:exopolysaccharide production protein ExoQ